MYIELEQVFRITGRNIYLRIHRNIVFHSQSLIQELASFRAAVRWLMLVDIRNICIDGTEPQVQFEWMNEREVHGYKIE